MQGGGSRHVDRASEDFAEVETKTGKVDERAALLELNEEIDVTGGSGFAAGH